MPKPRKAVGAYSAPEQPIDRAALLLGRAAATRHRARRRRLRGAAGTRWASDPHRATRAASASPRRSAKPVTFMIAHRAVERDRDDVAGLHRRGSRRVDALAVEPHMAVVDERGSGRARAHHARVPQPFVDALAVVVSSRRSLFASSCSFSAASLANGEFGSAWPPRRSFGSLHSRGSLPRSRSLKSRRPSRRGAAILPVAIRALAATALALRRTAFALLGLVAAFAAIAAP